jgi:flagellar assembly protein FliH
MTVQRFNFPTLQDKGMDGDAPFSGTKEFVESGRATAPANQPQKTFSEADLEKAKAESFKEGHDQGIKEGLAKVEAEKLEVDKKIAMLLADIQVALTNITGGFDKMLAEKTGEVLGIVMAICKKIAGDALKEFPEAKIESMVKTCLQMLTNQEEVNIFISDKILPLLQDKIAGIKEAEGFSGQIHLQADTTLPETSCRVIWKNGEARHDTQKLWQEVDRLLQNITSK